MKGLAQESRQFVSRVPRLHYFAKWLLTLPCDLFALEKSVVSVLRDPPPPSKLSELQRPRPQEAERLIMVASQLGMYLAVEWKMDWVLLCLEM